MVTPLPPRPNTAVTLLVSSASAAASRSWCSGRTTENRDNVFMNSRWSYNLGVSRSAPPAGGSLQRGIEHRGSWVTARAPRDRPSLRLGNAADPSSRQARMWDPIQQPRQSVQPAPPQAQHQRAGNLEIAGRKDEDFLRSGREITATPAPASADPERVTPAHRSTR